jgi:hypothetical protein
VNLSSFRPGLEKALALGGSTHTVDDVLDQIARGDAQLWVDDRAIVVTEVRQCPRKKVLYAWLATGELDACVTLLRRAVEWGTEQGCELAIATGRKGWTKPLRSEGWTETLVVLEQELG